MAAALPKEVRAARGFLRGHGISTKEIPPRKLANAAKELNKGFKEVLRLLMRLRSGGQNQAQERRENIRKAAAAE
jgi:hypothetical protein